MEFFTEERVLFGTGTINGLLILIKALTLISGLTNCLVYRKTELFAKSNNALAGFQVPINRKVGKK